MNIKRLILALIFGPSSSFAFVVKTSTALSKWSENSGSGLYFIEQEVQFSQETSTSPTGRDNGMHDLILKEQWLVMDESHMKLTVTGPGLRWVYVYENGSRYQQINGNKKAKPFSDQFVERYFHFRKPDHLQKTLAAAGVAIDPQPKLSRTGGVVALAIGSAADGATEDRPTLFLEQDQFVLRKFRFASGAEIVAEKYTVYPRGLQYPKIRTVRWTQKMGSEKQEKVVGLQTLHVQAKFEKKPQLNLESSQGGLPEGSMRSLVEEFYSRFR